VLAGWRGSPLGDKGSALRDCSKSAIVRKARLFEKRDCSKSAIVNRCDAGVATALLRLCGYFVQNSIAFWQADFGKMSTFGRGFALIFRRPNSAVIPFDSRR
jgi:hypothetical protein